MNPDYSELFDQRGGSYDIAMQTFPRARDQEFLQVVERMSLTSGMSVADVPAGGGYLQNYLCDGIELKQHEPCSSFTDHVPQVHSAVSEGRLLPLPWENSSIDVFTSIAGMHHEEDKFALFREALRVTRPGGQLVVSDVAEGSAVAQFLDDYVGQYNSTGHDGIFLNDGTIADIKAAGWQVMAAEIVDFHWVFATKQDMAVFCHTLFDIRDKEYQRTIDEIERRLGVHLNADGTIGMHWSLMTITAHC